MKKAIIKRAVMKAATFSLLAPTILYSAVVKAAGIFDDTVTAEMEPTKKSAVPEIQNTDSSTDQSKEQNAILGEDSPSLSGDQVIVQPKDLGNQDWLIGIINDQLNKQIGKNLTFGDLKLITRLTSFSQGHVGQIPPEIELLENLKAIVLFDNQLSGPLPDTLGNLQKLEDLVLYKNQFSGEIPESLGRLSKLQQLFLNDNQFTGQLPDSLNNLSRLFQVVVTNNQVTTDSATSPDFGMIPVGVAGTFISGTDNLSLVGKTEVFSPDSKVKPFAIDHPSYFDLKTSTGQELYDSHIYKIKDEKGIVIYEGPADDKLEIPMTGNTNYQVILDQAENNPNNVWSTAAIDVAKSVKDLFENENYHELADGVTEERLHATSLLVDKLPDSPEKTLLAELVEKAYQLSDRNGGTLSPAPYQFGVSHLTGTYTGEIVKASMYVNGKKVVTGGTFEDGGFSFYAAGRFTASDAVEIAGLDKNGKELDRQVVTFAETMGTLQLNEYKMSTLNITGTYTGDVAKATLYVNGTKVITGGTFEDGGFSFYAYRRFTKEDNVELAGLDKNGKELDRHTLRIVE
ncbi:immunoglobulin-like domain-containing protein [Enterococcus sp. ZJ1668]|uniref:immunoglobulin-like domain-containing protein n=1 Tax=Enterococcus sp. ZJ1668 TaxID=2709402 RepID=UPI0013EE3175|nr:immunoglobulin-like domain-containing protein [Enterococcus sp. ZJ1668]